MFPNKKHTGNTKTQTNQIQQRLSSKQEHRDFHPKPNEFLVSFQIAELKKTTFKKKTLHKHKEKIPKPKTIRNHKKKKKRRKPQKPHRHAELFRFSSPALKPAMLSPHLEGGSRWSGGVSNAQQVEWGKSIEYGSHKRLIPGRETGHKKELYSEGSWFFVYSHSIF